MAGTVDVFVSYASQDRARVRPLVERLIAEGWSVWWDREIGSGAAWDDEIEKALDQASCVLVAWSDAAVASEWVRTEAYEAARRSRLVPVLLDPVLLPLQFRRIQSRQLIGWPEVHDAFELAQLFTDVRKLVQAPAAEPSTPRAGVGGASQTPLRSERRSLTMLRVELMPPDGAWEDPEQLEDAIGAVRALLQGELDPQVSLFQDLNDTGFVCLFGVPMADELAEVHGIETALRLGEALKSTLGLDWRMALANGVGIVSPQAPGEAPRVTTSLRPSLEALLRGAADGQLLISASAEHRLAPFFEMQPGADGSSVVTARTSVRDRMTASEVLGLSPLSGREAEVAAIRAAVAAAEAGSGQAISLVADDGLGKSRMLREAAGELAGGAFQVLRMAGDAHGRSISHAAFAEPLRALLGGEGSELDEAAIALARPALAAYAAFLAQIVSPEAPESASAIGLLDAAAFNAACREAVLAAVTLAAAERPLALVFDDVQFADQASRDTIVALAGAIAHAPVLLLVAARPDAPPAWPAVSHCRQLVLSPLDVEATGVLLKAVAGARDIVLGLAAIVRRRTDGVPFFIEELCRALLESGAFSVVDGKLTTRAGFNVMDVPTSLEGLVRERLDQLAPQVRAVVQTAGVIGQQFEWSALRDLMALGGPAILHLGPAIAAGIVQQVRLVPEPVYRFPQQLMQIVARDSILVKERRELHRRIAEALEARDGDRAASREELAFHFAEAGCDDKAVEHLVAAASHALGWGSVQIASELADRAVQLLEAQPATPARDEVLLGAYATLGDAVQQYRGFDDPGLTGIFAKILQLAAAAPVGPRLLEPLWLLWRRYYAAMMLPEAQDCARRLSEIGDDPAIRMIALAAEGVIAYFQGEPGRASEVLSAAVALWDPEAMRGDTSGIPARAAYFAHLFLANSLVLYAEPRRAEPSFAAAEAMAEAANSANLGLIVSIYRQWGLLALGDYAACAPLNAASLSLALQLEHYHHVATGRLIQAVLLAKRGETQAAQALVRELESFFGPFVSTANGRLYLLTLIDVGFAAGDLREIPRCIELLRAQMKRLGTYHFLGHTEQAALMLNWPEDPQGARAQAEAAIPVLIASGNRTSHLMFAGVYAELLLAAGDAAAAQAVLEQVLAPLDPAELTDVPFHQRALALLDQAKAAG